jgi:hypothetical protein
MLSDAISDNLYCPVGPGTAKDRVRWFLEELDGYSETPFDYDEKHVAMLRNLAKAYRRRPSFVALQNLHRSSVAFMQAMDTPSATYDEFGCRLVIEDGELRFYPYRMSDEFWQKSGLPNGSD